MQFNGQQTTENQPLGDVIMCIINLTYLVLKSQFLEIRLFLKYHASPPSSLSSERAVGKRIKDEE